MFDYPLPVPKDTLYRKVGLDPAATATEIIGTISRVTASLTRRKKELDAQITGLTKMEPNGTMEVNQLAQLEKEAAELATQINDLNTSPLQTLEKRITYDCENPPLDLLKLRSCTRDELADNATLLSLLRRDIVQFLSEKGEQAYHPSDLTRDDFSDDFVYIPIIDDFDV